jgi:hypothetical protein
VRRAQTKVRDDGGVVAEADGGFDGKAEKVG